MVKWNQEFSSFKTVKGGGPQGGNAGILEYISLSAGNLDFLSVEDAFKFIDDASFLEILNLLSIGLTSYDFNQHVASDIACENLYVPPENIESQAHLQKISEWTNDNEMKINSDKTKYMIVNFCRSAQFSTRLALNNSVLEQVREVKLLGVLISDDLSWHSNTDMIVTKANKRMTILRKLFEFNVDIGDLKTIYVLYIRSIVEQSCVVWASSLTAEEEKKIERIQKKH